MTRERHARLREAFTRALPLAGEERRRALDESCAGDEDLRAEAEDLLARSERESPLLDGTLGAAARRHAEDALQAEPLPLPQSIGGHRVLRIIGEGASSIVYEAEQDRPRRRIALKVLRTALATPASLRRFEREAEILALLHHAGIAAIHEAGTAQLGGPSSPPQPWFAMELVRGLPVTEHADRAGLGPAERLALVAEICDAVQHAHARGIVHRDLKPANVLVDESGHPKVLDFGVARVLDPDLASATLRTGTGQVVGTLPYMSPEQVSASPGAVGPPSDVHALGVMAYELLVRRLPHGLEGLGLAEATRVIREEDPARLGSIDRRLRGDAEIIVAKALEKDPARRYPGAAAMADDIRRMLAGRPIQARPQSAAYQVGRFARRHRALVASIVLTFAALVAGAAVATRQAVLARRSEARAVQQAYRASLAAAVGALEQGDATLARRHLDAAPEALRGWEWTHLDSRLDRSLMRWSGEPGDRLDLAVSSDGDFAEATRIGEGDSPAARMRLGSWALREEGARESPLRATGTDRPLLTRLDSPLIAARAAVFRAGEREVEVRSLRGPALAVLRPCDVGGDSTLVALAGAGPVGLLASVASEMPGDRVAAVACDLSSGAPVGPPLTFERFVTALSADGSLLAIATGSGRVAVHDVATGAPLHELQGPLDYITHLSFAPQGSRLLTAGKSGTLRCWDASTGDRIAELKPAGLGAAQEASWSPDASIVAVAGSLGSVRLLAPDLSRELAVLHGHRAAVSALAFGAGSEGLSLFSVDVAGDLLRWDPVPREDRFVLRGHDSYVNPVAFLPGGSRLVSGGWDGRVVTWDVASGARMASFQLDEPRFVTDLACSPSGDRLLAGSPSLDLRLLDAATGAVIARRAFEGRKPGLAWSGALGVVAVALEPSGPLLLLDPATLETRREIAVSGAPRALSPDGRTLAVAGEESLLLVDLAGGGVRTSIAAPGVTAAAFAPDGRAIVTGTTGGVMGAWNVADGSVRARLPDAPGLLGLAWAPDGSRFASAHSTGVVRLWDVATWTDVIDLRGHEAYAHTVAFSPDGSTLASSSGDGTVRLWRTTRGEPAR